MKFSTPLLLILLISLPISAWPQTQTGRTASQEDSVRLINRVTISADLPETPHAEPHLSLNPSNPDELLVASIVFPDSARHRVHAFRSTDTGHTWNRETLHTVDSLGTIDPWTGFDRHGNSYVSLLTATTFTKDDRFMSFKLFRKNQEKPEWEKPYTHVLQRGNGGSFDQPKMTIDLSPDSRFTNRLYISSNRWARPTKLRNGTKAVALMYSDNGGDSFSKMKYIAENNFRKQSLNTQVLSDGTVIGGFFNYMTVEPRSMSTRPVWTFKSFDGGESVSYPNIVTTQAVDMPLLAADTTSSGYKNRIYMAGVISGESPALAVLHSDSRGERWSDPQPVRRLTVSNRIVHYAATDAKGRLGIIWTRKTREVKGEECYSVNFSYSLDGGNTFETKNLLDEGSYCVEIPGEPVMYTMAPEYRPVNPRFSDGGEYLGLVGLPEGGFYAVWVQTVNGVLQLKGGRLQF